MDIKLRNFMNFKYAILLLLVLAGNNQVLASADEKVEQNQLLNEWFAAARAGNQEVMEKLVVKVGVNARDDWDCTALMHAIMYNRENIVKFLLSIPDVNVNALNKSGFTAVMEATIKGHENILKLLLQIPNLDINIRSKPNCYTTLTYAINKRDENIVRLVLGFPGINVNIQNSNGITALMDTAILGYTNLANILLQCPNININAKDKNGKTALIYAIEYDRSDITECIQAKITELTNRAFESVLAKASSDAERQNNLEILKSIIAQVGDKITDGEGNTLLDKAFAANKPDIILFLLQNSADPRKLLSRFPFEAIQPSSEIFKLCVYMAYATADLGTKKESLASAIKLNLCSNCVKPECTKKCGGCRKVFYCSTQCQKQHWRTHKINCMHT